MRWCVLSLLRAGGSLYLLLAIRLQKRLRGCNLYAEVPVSTSTARYSSTSPSLYSPPLYHTIRLARSVSAAQHMLPFYRCVLLPDPASSPAHPFSGHCAQCRWQGEVYRSDKRRYPYGVLQQRPMGGSLLILLCEPVRGAGSCTKRSEEKARHTPKKR